MSLKMRGVDGKERIMCMVIEMLEASHMSRISAHSSVAPAVIASSLGFCGDSFAIDVSHFERLGMQSGI